MPILRLLSILILSLVVTGPAQALTDAERAEVERLRSLAAALP